MTPIRRNAQYRVKNALQTTDAIKGPKAQRNVTKLKSMLEFCMFLILFVPRSAKIALSLDNKYRKAPHLNSELNEKELKAMQSLPNKNFFLPVLALP